MATVFRNQLISETMCWFQLTIIFLGGNQNHLKNKLNLNYLTWKKLNSTKSNTLYIFLKYENAIPLSWMKEIRNLFSSTLTYLSHTQNKNRKNINLLRLSILTFLTSLSWWKMYSNKAYEKTNVKYVIKLVANKIYLHLIRNKYFISSFKIKSRFSKNIECNKEFTFQKCNVTALLGKNS